MAKAEETEQLLHHFNVACSRGDIETVNALVASGVDVNAIYKCRVSSLIAACRCDQLEVVKLLLSKGAKIETPVGSALLDTLSRGRDDISKLFIEQGADLRARDQRSGKTSLILAADSSSLDVVKMIVDKCGDEIVNLQSKSGETALVRAAARGDVAIARFLLSHGAKMNVEPPVEVDDDDSEDEECEAVASPLHMAATKDHIEMVNFLIDQGAVFVDASDFKQTIGKTSQYHSFEIVKSLLKLAATSFDAATIHAAISEAFRWACIRDVGDAVAFLFEEAKKYGQPIDPNAAYGPNGNFFICLVQENRLEVCRCLLSTCGANPNFEHKTPDGELVTPLKIACLNCNLEMIELLLKFGAKVNTLDENGSSLLALFFRKFQRHHVGLAQRIVDVRLAAGAVIVDPKGPTSSIDVSFWPDGLHETYLRARKKSGNN